MMKPQQLHNKSVLVVGLGVTGLSVVRFLRKHNVVFAVADQNTNQNQATLDELGGATLHAGFDEALFSNADVIVLSPGVPRAHPAVRAALANGVKVIGDIELFASVVEKPVIAVTGSNGKSTVVSWMAHVLAQTDLHAVLCGNIGQPALDSISDDADVYVLELSSYQLESTESLAPFAASVLNISDDHMDRYDSLDHYADVKQRIYRGCQHAVANRDDARTWPQNMQEESVRFFAVVSENPGDYQCIDGETRQINVDGETIIELSSLRLPGEHNVANALATVALLAPLNIDQQRLQAGVNSFGGLPHRSQFIADINGVAWYNDSKGTNIDACKKAVEAMPGPVVLIAGGQGKGADFKALRDVVTQYVKTLVLIGQDRQLIADALHDLAEVRFCDSMNDAVIEASTLATPGDAVLMSPACASFDMFDNFEQRGEHFCRAVQELAA